MGRAHGQGKEAATVWTFAAGGAVTLGDRKGPGTVLQSPGPEAAQAGHESCQDPEGTTWSAPASACARDHGYPLRGTPGSLLEGSRTEEMARSLSICPKETESSKRN